MSKPKIVVLGAGISGHTAVLNPKRQKQKVVIGLRHGV